MPSLFPFLAKSRAGCYRNIFRQGVTRCRVNCITHKQAKLFDNTSNFGFVKKLINHGVICHIHTRYERESTNIP